MGSTKGEELIMDIQKGKTYRVTDRNDAILE